MESWEIDGKINNHPVIQMFQTRMYDIQELLNGWRPDRNMVHQLRGELGWDPNTSYDKGHPNGHIYQRLNILEQRMTTVESSLSTIEKAIIHLCHQLGYAETLRVPEPTPLEERLEENA